MGYKTKGYQILDAVLLSPEQLEKQRGENLAAYQKKVEAISAVIREKEEEKERIIQSCEDLAVRLSEMRAAERALVTRTENLTTEIDRAFATARADLKRERDEVEANIEAEDARLIEYGRELKALEEMVSLREAAVAKREESATSTAAHLEKLTGEAIRRDQALDVRETELNKRDADLAARAREVAKLSEDLTTLTLELDEKEDALKKEKADFALIKAGVEQEKATCLAINEKVEKDKAAIEAQMANLKTAREDHDRMMQDLKNYEESLKRIDSKLKERQRLMDAAKGA